MRIYITTCDKKTCYAKRVKKMLENCPYEYLFVYGRGNKDKVEPFIEFDFDETYDNLPEKTYRLVEHFLTTSGDEQMVKIDDDTFLDWKKLSSYGPENDYIGGFINWGCDGSQYTKEQYVEWYKTKIPNYKERKKQYPIQYAEGGFYILNRKSCEEILKHKQWFCDVGYDAYLAEDTLVGICLKDLMFSKKNIPLEPDMKFDLATDGLFIHPVNLILFQILERETLQSKKVDILKRSGYFVPPKYKS